MCESVARMLGERERKERVWREEKERRWREGEKRER